MNDEKVLGTKTVNKQRRKLLQGAVCVGAAGFAPAVLAKSLTGDTNSAVSGRLVSNIADPVKTLFLSNHSDKAIVIEHVSQGAFMFDGEIVDCNAACVGNTLTIPANQEVEVKFERRKQFNQLTKAEDFRRFQSRVTRLHDGTRVIPFTAKVRGKVASIV